MKANLATSLIAYARGGVRKQLLVLCLLTLCVGNMWGGDFTVYVTGEIFTGKGDNAWDNQTSVIKVDVRYQGNDNDFKDSDVYKDQEMTCTDYTYNGYPIYSYTFTPTWGGGQFRFKHYKNGDWKEDYTSDWHSITEQIYRGYYNDGHQWMVYARDVTVYTVPEYLFKDYSTKFSEDKHYPSVCVQYGVGVGEWKTIDMVKTDYTYDNYPIWKATFLLDYNIFKEFQIKYFDKANSQQVGLYQYNQGGKTEYPSSELDDKLYHGWNGESHDFFPYTYDVKLDQQDGSGGTESIKATDGVVLPAATKPGRDGYIFGGYYTEIGGRGDQYYDTDCLSSTKWNSRTITTLYAKWTARNYTVNLEDPPTTTPVTVTFDATLSSITPPTKMYYTFDGYWTDNDDTGATLDKQLIDKDGNWEKSISPYTGTSGDNATWIYPNGKSLFAKWDEDLHDVTIAVYPADAGVVQVSGETVSSVSDVGYVTHSPELTAVPSNAAWVFKEWCVSDDTKLHLDLENYSKFDETMEITATDDGQTLTAVFEPRFCLVGAKWDNSGNGGMPGWHDYTADFIVNSYTDLSTMNLTCVRSLDPNTTYKFEVHDKVKGQNFGYSGEGTYIADQSLPFNTQNNDVFLRVNGHGECTFTISALSSGDLYPTVSVAIPASHQLNLEWADVDIDNNWNKTSRGTGGSVSAQTTESGHNSAICNGEYVAHGGDITYTATPVTGYTFEGWYNNDYKTRFSTTNPYTSSNIQTTENMEAKFVEKATAVILSNDGHGKVQINSTDQTSTTCGVTTTRQLNAVPNSGYSFSSWSITGSDISLSATNTNPTTLTGGGSGASSQSVTANFSANNYTITLDDNHGGTTSASVTYDATSLTSISHASFEGWNLLGYWNTDGNKVIEANGDIVANVVNYTGSSGEWNYADNVTLYAHWSRSITLDNKEGSSNGSVTVNYDESTTASLSAPSRTGYHVEGYYADNDRTHKVMEANGTLVNYTGYVESGKWVHATATTLYTKWAPDEYTVTLDPREVESGDEGTPSVTVYYETSTNMTSAITKPTKAHYTFSGYYTGYDNVNKVVTGSKLIDGNGNWIKDVTGFTGHDGDNPTWVNVSDYTLYADWTETMYPVAIAISPAEAGNVQVSGETVTEVTAGYAMHSPEMTAVPANAAWVFKEWQVTSNAHLDLEHYSTTGTTMKITATDDDQKLTAVFEPRYYLVGGEIMSGEDGVGTGTSSGMPGWDNYNKPFEIVTNSPILATCSLTLGTNKNFYIMVRDKADGFSYGKSGGVSLGDGTSLKFENKDNRVFFYSNGGTAYTFKITDVDGSGRPTVSVERPYQVNIGRKRVDIDGNDHDDNTGGTVDLSKQTAPETWTPISNGDWVPYGTSVKYDASKQTGYTVDWYNASDYVTWFSNADYWFHTATSTGNGYAKFTEISTSVTLSNDGHGKIQIGGVDATSTTCGVTTTRELTAVPNDGYKFLSWTHVSGDDIELSSTSTNPTTLRGVGGGVSSGQEVRANFIERWIVQPEVGEWKYAYFTIEHIEEVGGKTIGYVDITLEANTNYQFSVVDRDGDVKYKNGSNQVYYMTNGNSHNWGFATDKSFYCGITTAGAGVYRFTWNITDKKMTVTYPNFIIYRTGDKADDPRAQSTDVESYEGGTIEKAIEYRMKVQTIDQWYSLSLPFAVSAVKVWDDEDGAYYDIVPFYRSGGKFYTGHYIIRKPETVTNYAIETFEEKWVDPDNSGVLPEKNIPYIIQWHDPYFFGKYISFFGSTNQTIPADFNAGEAPSADDVVNVFGNNTMHSGTVKDAYLLDKDYGPSGAWLRQKIGTNRTVLPFECFIRANTATTKRYLILRRGMEETDTPTALEQISNHQSPMTIRVYTITGLLVGEYNDCSFQDAAHRIATDHNEGIYILRSENESMKLLLGGK